MLLLFFWYSDPVVGDRYRHGLRCERQTPNSTTGYRYDANGRLAELVIDDTHQLSLLRDALGRDVRRSDATGFIQQQVFDATGLLLQQLAAYVQQSHMHIAFCIGNQ